MNGLTAWERWELTTFDADTPSKAEDAETEPVQLDREEIERICAEARQDGHQTGYAAGQAAAKAEALRLARAADGLDKALAEFDQQVADELLALAAEIARQVIRTELSARPDIILGIVNEALTQLPHQHATIYLHPDDASLVRSYAGDALTHAGHRILEEPKLTPGDCLLESGGSQLDASLATRWRRVVASLGLTSVWNEPDGQ
jgi:flagellar assembly protein FliH